MRLLSTLAAAALLAGSLAAQAQTTQPSNPLRPANTRNAAPAQTTAPAATQAPAAEAPKPKRQRSEAQLANDNRMRECGKEWRANKEALTKQGKTWRVYNVECRARLKAAGR